MRAAATAIVGLCALPLLAGSASAQNEERYQLERTDDGYVRMDTETGVMTLCREEANELVCRPATEGRAEGRSEIELLRDRVAELETRVQALEGSEGTAPLEEEFEQTLTMMERFFRSFVDIVRGLEEEQQEQQPEQQQEQTPGSAPAERT